LHNQSNEFHDELLAVNNPVLRLAQSVNQEIRFKRQVLHFSQLRKSLGTSRESACNIKKISTIKGDPLTDQTAPMQPWTRDASAVQIGSLPQTPYARPNLQDFLSAELGSSVKILVAPKGYGKTLLLKQKAYNLRAKLKGIPIFPAGASDIEFLKLSLEWREVFQLTKPLTDSAWALIWQLVLLGKGVQLVSEDDLSDDQLRLIFKDPRAEIGTLLTEVLRQNHLNAINIAQKLPLLRSIFNNSDQAAVIFIDNTDEMFVGVDLDSTTNDRHITANAARRSGSAKKLEDQSKEPINDTESISIDPSIWSSAQVGLMLAVHEIERSSRKLNVYTSLRAEAILTANHPLAPQAMVHTVRIQYTHADLKQVFAWHVNLMKVTDLVAPEASDSEERLIGPQKIVHSYVKVNGRPAEESLVELIVRHTCCSPRELVILGEAVASLSAEERSGSDRDYLIRRRINDNAISLYTSFRDNFIPRWPVEIDAALLKAPSAVMDERSVLQLGSLNASKLFAFGLLGYAVETQTTNHYRQVFLNQWDSRFRSNSLALPTAKYYFLHPWLFDYCANHSSAFLRSPKNIIGDGCMFEPPPASSISLSRDRRGQPILEVGDEVVWPNKRSTRLTMPAIFLMILTIAIYQEGSTYITDTAFKAAAVSFYSAFPHLKSVQTLNPFEREDHRAHIKKSVDAAFPNLRKKFSHLSELFEFPSGKVGERYIGLSFIDPNKVRFEV
jgi:hypothetical protein